jgi:predicted Zn-dependent protease with MMP-like domain
MPPLLSSEVHRRAHKIALAWRNLKAPSLAEFELLADSAFRRLPQKFRALCEGLVIRVEDFPEEKILGD